MHNRGQARSRDYRVEDLNLQEINKGSNTEPVAATGPKLYFLEKPISVIQRAQNELSNINTHTINVCMITTQHNNNYEGKVMTINVSSFGNIGSFSLP